jgi:hypothetical protein
LEHGFLHLLFVSAVVMCIAHTITKERIFLGLRDRLGGKDTFCGYLASCPYCASHWIALVVTPLTGAFYLRVPYDWGVWSTIGTWFLSSILVTIIAAFLRIFFFFVDESQGLVRRRQREVETVVKKMETTLPKQDEPQTPRLQ